MVRCRRNINRCSGKAQVRGATLSWDSSYWTFYSRKKKKKKKSTSKIIETKLSQQNIHLIQSFYLVRPPFTRMTASQQLRIEATYRIQVCCTIPFHPNLTNCSNCISNICRVPSPYYTADNVPDMGQILSIRFRSVIWMAKTLTLFASRRFTVMRALWEVAPSCIRRIPLWVCAYNLFFWERFFPSCAVTKRENKMRRK